VLSYRIEAAPGDATAALRSIETALGEWQATGCARFVPVAPLEHADLTFAWHGGEHAGCAPFGVDPSLAHAGPLGPGTFVHFDCAREWTRAELRRAALHEIGHVLGLDHSPDERAVMYALPGEERAHLGASDRAAVHSLYGGGEPGPGDLWIVADGVELALRAVAPPALSDWTVFDTDGDGDDELLVWRTDAAGHGALVSYHFAPGPRLARTLGPFYGFAGAGCEPRFVRTSSGERWIVLEAPGASRVVRSFDAAGIPAACADSGPLRCGASASLRSGDLDGDGRVERVQRRE
jgi:hypothetical protein